MALLEVNNLKKYYPMYSGVMKRLTGYYKAVDDISLSIDAGETYGLVGESGCGKTTVGKSILRLIEPTAGKILLDQREISAMNARELRAERKNMQIIFQDPYSSMDPKMRISDIIAEPIREHKLAQGAELRSMVEDLLKKVGIDSREMSKYPHEFSGGQRQRIAIARALAAQPKLIVCDEPVSALDVSVQAQILNLMSDLQKEYGISYLFIAHGMPVVQHISHRVGVMYLGHIVETADSLEIFRNSLHPYTKALMSAIPIPNPAIKKTRKLIKGEVPNLINTPRGCLFAGRCEHCMKKCHEISPSLLTVAPGHQVACHLFTEE